MPAVLNSIPLRISYERTVDATEQNRTERNGTARVRWRGSWQATERLLRMGREWGEKTGEGISSVEELRGVFFVACTTKSLTTNAKRRLHRLLPFRSEKLHELGVPLSAFCCAVKYDELFSDVNDRRRRRRSKIYVKSDAKFYLRNWCSCVCMLSGIVFCVKCCPNSDAWSLPKHTRRPKTGGNITRGVTWRKPQKC